MIEHFLWGIVFIALSIFNYEINRTIHHKTLEEKQSFSHIWNQIELHQVEVHTNNQEKQ